MRTVVYSMSVSVDGLIAGPAGDIGWSAPCDELMVFHNQQPREIGAHLCGRGLYENMLPWETLETSDPRALEFARMWKAMPKVVFSTTLEHIEGHARLARDDVAGEGAGLAATLINLDLIDEYRQFVYPIVLGGGTAYFPPLTARLGLEPLETRTFGSRVVYLRYRRG